MESGKWHIVASVQERFQTMEESQGLKNELYCHELERDTLAKEQDSLPANGESFTFQHQYVLRSAVQARTQGACIAKLKGLFGREATF